MSRVSMGIFVADDPEPERRKNAAENGLDCGNTRYGHFGVYPFPWICT